MKVKEKQLKLKQGCSECSEDKDKGSIETNGEKERWVKVASILKDIHYPTKETFEGAVNSFVKSSLSLDEIERLAVTLRPNYIGPKERNAIHYKNTRAVGVW